MQVTRNFRNFICRTLELTLYLNQSFFLILEEPEGSDEESVDDEVQPPVLDEDEVQPPVPAKHDEPGTFFYTY